MTGVANHEVAAARVSALALAFLSAVTALAFESVFRDGSYLLPALGAALFPHAIGWVGRRLRCAPAIPVVVSVLALGLYVTWTAAGSTTFFGLPGSDTPQAILATLRDGWGVLRTGVAPVPTTEGVVLLTVVALWIMATTADALAFAGEAPLGAIVPSLVVFVVASSVAPGDLNSWTTGLYLAAATLCLAVCHRGLLERRRSWFAGRKGSSRGPTSLGVGAALAAFAIVAGLVVVPVLPGADAEPLLDYKSPAGGVGRYESSSNPLVDLAARLGTPSTEERFTVESPQRLYWRQVALDRFDGSQWTLESSSRRASGILDDGSADDGGEIVEQRFRLTGITERWLPAAYEPLRISLGDARILPESLTLFNADAAVIGLEYGVVSRVPPSGLTPAQIEATKHPVPDEADLFLELPGDFPPSVRRTARQLTAGAATPYDRAIVLRDFFTGGAFAYDLDVPAGSSNRAMEEFLEVRRGFCQQFAGTYAAMARSVGLPSRVVVGYNPGSYDALTERFRVTDADAHAWVEVWLAGVGWTLMEPTPAGSQPGATDPGIGLPARAEPGGPTATTSTTLASPVSSPTTAVRSAPVTGGRVAVDPGADGAVGAPDRTPWIVLGVVAVALGLVLLRIGQYRVRRARRRARRRTGAPRAAVVGAWAEAIDRLEEHGIASDPSETPREIVVGAAEHGDPGIDTRAPLGRLADSAALALWSPTDPAAHDVDRAWSDLSALERAFREHTPRGTRVRRWFGRLLAPVDVPDHPPAKPASSIGATTDRS